MSFKRPSAAGGRIFLVLLVKRGESAIMEQRFCISEEMGNREPDDTLLLNHRKTDKQRIGFRWSGFNGGKGEIEETRREQ